MLRLGATDPSVVLREIDLARAELRDPPDFIRGLGGDPRELLQHYVSEMRRTATIDFAQALIDAVSILADEKRARPHREQLREIVVDEFQDLSPAQVALLDALASSPSGSSNRCHVTIVGDPRQAIYEWNGARPRELMRRSRSDDTGTVELVDNFRSQAEVVSLANSTIAQVLPTLSPIRSVSSGQGTVELHEAPSETAMLDEVGVTVQSWIEAGVSDDEIAVLAFRSATVASVGRALSRRGVAWHDQGLPKVSQTEVFIRLQGEAGHGSVPEESDALAEFDSLEPAVLGEDPTADTQDDWERLRAAVAERSTLADLPSVLISIARSDEGPRSRAGVTITTLHRAKGLEWDAVAVTDVGAGSALDGLDGSAERCRLLYVGLTRARARLHVSWHGERSRWLP